uniref:Uncharacterized protein n=1 Tax=Ditylum brightwellii TaxID=49249 RepID=A0A6U3S4I7_9STRA|mmetsp:Transcript_30062/g.44709  ORF Transcript_30062/g.44709 Transcript_30062/m.44709 type:complete len:107 (+) Transcript_30062:370-690(+)
MATGTSSLQGKAAEATTQQQCPCTLTQEQPSISHLGPMQQHGRQGAPGLQQYSQLRQHNPAFPEQPRQSYEGRTEQLAQQTAQQRISSFSSIASSPIFSIYLCEKV